ncbi:MAG TPA: hypothetical protein DD491_09070 [Halieaceae bacterium]|nr:hypothetical protein [Halieaceae bacterium]
MVSTLMRNTIVLITAICAPSLALAGGGGSGTVTLGPASPTAVPAMTPAMMVGLGLLLAVIALRVLRQSGAAQRVMSFLLLGSAGVVGGLGVERTIATNTLETGGSDCNSPTIVLTYAQVEERPDTVVTNGCTIDLEIVGYNLSCPGGYTFNDNGSPVGTVVPAGDSVPSAYCESTPP